MDLDLPRDRSMMMIERLKEKILEESRTEIATQQRLRASTWQQTRMSSINQRSAVDSYNSLMKSRDQTEIIEELNARLVRQMFLDDEKDEDAYSTESANDYKDKIEYASDD